MVTAKAEELAQERVRLANRLREQLRRTYPQALQVTDDVAAQWAAEWFLDLWARLPTPEKARRARQSGIARLLAARRIRKIDAAGLLAILRQKPLTVAPGTVEAAGAHIRALSERLRLINRQIKQAHKRIDALCGAIATEGDEGDEGDETPGQKIGQRDVEILRSLPGVGRIVLATLLAEAFGPLCDRDYHALRSLSGVAPVTRSSGKHRVVVMRKACHMRLRTALYHWALVAIQHDPVSRDRYAVLRARGHGHGRALRSVADRLLGVACAMLQNQTLFDPNHHAKTLRAA